MKSASPGIAALAAVIVAAVPAVAHHSHPAFYDACMSVTVEGDIDSVQWKNPHVLIDLTATDGKAYRVEWTSAGALERNSVPQPKVGDHIVVVGNPMRDVSALRAKFPTLTLEPPTKLVIDLAQIRRAADGWSWSRNEPVTSSDCGRK
jgi:hypothetical protein